MLLDHAPHSVEVLKFASLEYDVFKSFIHAVEDVLFNLREAPPRPGGGRPPSYTKDEITVDVQDEYIGAIDKCTCLHSIHSSEVIFRLFPLLFLCTIYCCEQRIARFVL